MIKSENITTQEKPEEHVKMNILFDKGTYEVYTYLEDAPTTYANLFVDTKRHQYFIEKSEGKLSSKSGVEYLVEKLKDNFVSKIAECTNKESLSYRSNSSTIDSLCGPTLLSDSYTMNNLVKLYNDCSISYIENAVLEKKDATLEVYDSIR